MVLFKVEALLCFEFVWLCFIFTHKLSLHVHCPHLVASEHSYNKDLFLAFKLAPDLASIEHGAHHYVSTGVVNLYNTTILRTTTAFLLALTTLTSFFKKIQCMDSVAFQCAIVCFYKPYFCQVIK